MLRLRDARGSDAALLFEWRNDVDVRRWSFAPGPVRWADHVAWLREVLGDPRRRLYIVEVGGMAVGQVRLDATDEGEMISVSICPEARGRGIGSAVVQAACEHAAGDVVARIKAGNHASIAAFERAGFAPRTWDSHGDAVTLVWKRQ